MNYLKNLFYVLLMSCPLLNGLEDVEDNDFNEENVMEIGEETAEVEMNKSDPYESMEICPYPPEDLIRIKLNSNITAGWPDKNSLTLMESNIRGKG